MPTNPHINTPFDVAAIRQRFEKGERINQQLENNRAVAVPSLAGLKDTNALGRPSDGDIPSYDMTSGLWLPKSIAATAAGNDNKVATTDTLTSTSYVATLIGGSTGPVVTANTGAVVIIILTAQMFNATASASEMMGFAISGSTTFAAADVDALIQSSGSVFAPVQASRVLVLSGLTPGSNTFTAMYKTLTGTATFANREITVIV